MHRLEVIETTAQQTYEWLNELEEKLGWTDHHRALQGLRGVLHALRDHLTIEQSAHLAAQLPTIVRGIYFEGWRPIQAPLRERQPEAFLDPVRAAMMGYGGEVNAEKIARAAFAVLQSKISPGEGKRVLEGLPKRVRELLEA